MIQSAPPSEPALFRAFVGLQRRLPWEPLVGGLPPVHPLSQIPLNGLWIKRDDQTSPVCGGTKVRKLEFLLGAARARGRSRLVTIGAAGSHHLLATAVFAKRLGMACDAVVCGQLLSPEVRRNLLALHTQSVRLTYGGGEIGAALHFLWRSMSSRGKAYLIPPGGSSPVGALGLVSAAFELAEQVRAGAMPRPAAIVCALGSGGTLAGLALGSQLAGVDAAVVGVRTYPAWKGLVPVATVGRVRRLMRRTLRLLQSLDPEVPNGRLRTPLLLEDHLGGGYAVPSPSGASARRLLAETEGIELDPTYTAKAFAGVLELRRALRSREVILYWHSYAEEHPEAETPVPDYRVLPAEFHFMWEG